MTFAGFGLVAAVGISGCGSSSDGAKAGTGSGESSGGTPKDKVVAAFENFESSSNAGFTLALDSSAADIKKIAAAQPKSSADALTASDIRDLEQVLAGKVTMNVTAADGKTFGDSVKESNSTQDYQSLLQDPAALEAALKGQGSFAMSVVLDDAGLVDFVTKDGVIYLRTDAEKVAKMSGLGDVSQAESLLTQMPPSIAKPAQTLLDGGWVSLDLVETVKVLDEQGVLDQLPTETATPVVDEARLQAFLTTLQTSFETESAITEVDGGDQGDGYRVSVPVEKIATAVQDDLIALVGQDSAKEIRKSIKDIPSGEKVTFDVFVEDEKLSGINVDLTQFLDKPVKDVTFAVSLDVDADASPVQVPSGATAVDVKSILNSIPADTLSGLDTSSL